MVNTAERIIIVFNKIIISIENLSGYDYYVC